MFDMSATVKRLEKTISDLTRQLKQAEKDYELVESNNVSLQADLTAKNEENAGLIKELEKWKKFEGEPATRKVCREILDDMIERNPTKAAIIMWHSFMDEITITEDKDARITVLVLELEGALEYIDKHFTCNCDSQPSGCGIAEQTLKESKSDPEEKIDKVD